MTVTRDQTGLASEVVSRLGGRYSTELGIDVDADDGEVERWFLAATLFGARISAAVAEHSFRTLTVAGAGTIDQLRDVPADEVVALLDAGGFAHYDVRMTRRLRALAAHINLCYDGEVSALGRRNRTYAALRSALLDLPGWGPATGDLFLRELRGVWAGAQPPIDRRALLAGRHLGLIGPGDDDAAALAAITDAADEEILDPRDLECALVRLTLAHCRLQARCPGGRGCLVLRKADEQRS